MGARAGGADDLAKGRAKLAELIKNGTLPADRGISPEDLQISTRKGKRFMIRDPKLLHFGSASHRTFMDIGDAKIRAAWLARHNYDGPPKLGTPGWWATNLLW